MKANKLTILVNLILIVFTVNAQNGTVKSYKKIKNGDPGLSGIDFSQMRLFGSGTANVGDIDKDGIIDIAVRGYNKSTQKGSVYILFLKTDGSVKSIVEIAEGKGGLPNNFTTASLEGFGTSLTSIGDFDKDGINDIAVGNTGITTSFQGEIYILTLNSSGNVKNLKIIREGENGFNGNLVPGDAFASGIASLGDLDKDGVIDLAVGASGDSEFGNSKGAIWILFLNADKSVKSHKKLNSGTAALSSLANQDVFGESVSAIGDIDKDGNIDIAVGSPFSEEGGTNRGAVRIIFLNSDGTIKQVSKITHKTNGFNDSLPNNTLFGEEVSFLGDLDGDGIPDITVGATNYNNAQGALWNIFLNSDGTCKSFHKITSNTSGFTITLNDLDAFGSGPSWLGDINGDGMYDILTAASLDDEGGTDVGALYILFLNGKSRLSAEDIYKENALLYPNPATSNITVNLPGAVNNPVIEIFNMAGQKVIEQQYETNGNTLQVALPELEKGVYTVKIKSENILYYNKLLISR